MTQPIDYQVVKIGEREYVLKYSLLAQYYLSRHGVSQLELLSVLAEFERAALATIAEGKRNFVIPAKWLAAVIDAWAACVSHMYVGTAEQAPTSDQWAAMLEPEFEKNSALPFELFAKLRLTIGKVPQPSATAPAVAAAERAPQPS
jgi:acetyl-CoA acetyltransferase